MPKEKGRSGKGKGRSENGRWKQPYNGNESSEKGSCENVKEL